MHSQGVVILPEMDITSRLLHNARFILMETINERSEPVEIIQECLRKQGKF